MAVNEEDLDLLHSYLDGELSTAESEGLWRRLAIERDLSCELDALRADHAVRGMVWTTLEPDDHTVARVQARLMRATRREDILSNLSRFGRIATSAAALILFGVTIGWMGKNHVNGVPNSTALSPSAATHSVAGENLGLPTSQKFEVDFHDPSSGKLVRGPQFNTREEANQYLQRLSAAQSGAAGAENSVPSIDKF